MHLHHRSQAQRCQHAGSPTPLVPAITPCPRGLRASQKHRQPSLAVLASGGGFGSSSNKKRSGDAAASTTKARPQKTTAPPPAAGASSSLRFTATAEQLAKGNWIELLPDVDSFFAAAGKDIKAITLAAGKTLTLYREGGVVYCTDVNSTAYQFPMIDADLLPGKGLNGGPAVEVPLDGTQYDLTTGKVLQWCPKSDNMLKNVFASLKRTATPVDLPVFPTHVTPDGKLRVRLVKD